MNITQIIKDLTNEYIRDKDGVVLHNGPWDYFVSILKHAIVRSLGSKNDILLCTTASILEAAARCAKDGLMPDGRQAALVKFATTCTYMPMYGGMLDVAYSMQVEGQMVYRDIEVEVIYEGEEAHFQYQRGDGGFIRFTPPLDRDIDKEIVGAYAIVRVYPDGVFREVMGKKDLAKVRAVSRAKSGPNKDWPGEMAKKAPLRRILKRTPRDNRLKQVLDHDDDTYLPSASEADETGAHIPNEALFEDKRHEPTPPADDNASELVVKARSDMMACETEDQLDGIIEQVQKATNTGKRAKKGFFTEAERDELLANAATLREHRWPKAGHEAELADGEEVAAELREAARPTETENAQPAGPGPGTSGSASPASPASPGPKESGPSTLAGPTNGGSPGSEAPSGAAGAPSSFTNNSHLRQGFEMAPPERRMTPQEAILADPSEDVHFKTGFTPNAAGQIPFFNGRNEIIGFAKPDLDIPVRDREASPPAPAPAAAAAPATAPAGPAEQPQIRENPEDRRAPGEEAAEEEEDGYGAAAEEKPVHVVYYLKTHPTKPPAEFTDPVEWRDAMLFKMNALKEAVAPVWWGDNVEFVEAALSSAAPQAGRVLKTAADRKLPGATALLEKHGIA
jgi:recombination protein RecT